MANNLFHALAGMCWTASAAIVVLLALRRLIRYLFGAQLAYLAWAVVPVALLTTLLTTLLAAMLPSIQTGRQFLGVAAPMLRLATYTGPAFQSAGAAWINWALMAWALGSAALVTWCWRDHTRFLARSGQLAETDGILHAASTSSGPALIGVWKPRIIVPSDFYTRYTALEQRLILAHENEHARRRDPVCNALCGLLQCVFWFNPLVHFAAKRFRFDQELACDAQVMLQHGGARRAYADAMLKTQLNGNPPLITCNWQSNHPLKERIMHLKQTQPGASRRIAGRLVIAALACAGAYGSLSANASPADATPGDTGWYQIDMQLSVGDASSSPRLRVPLDRPFTVISKINKSSWEGEFILHRVTDKTVKLDSVLKLGDKIIGKPSVLVALGEQAGITVGSDQPEERLNLRLTVVQAAATPVK
jgi:bla regulator protein BlaR1